MAAAGTGFGFVTSLAFVKFMKTMFHTIDTGNVSMVIKILINFMTYKFV